MRFLKRLITTWLICMSVFLGIFGGMAGSGWLFVNHPVILLIMATGVIAAIIVAVNS